MKVDQLAKGGSAHKLAADHKIKVKMSEFGGVDAECKGNQEGKLEFKSEWKGLSVSAKQQLKLKSNCILES